MSEQDAGFDKYNDFLDEEYGDEGMDGLYNDTGENAPDFDCPMQAVLETRKLVKGVSKNPQSEVKDFARAEFKIVKILDQKDPIDGGVSKMRKDGLVGDFDRLPPGSNPNFPERLGLKNTAKRVAAIMGIRPGDVDMDLLNMAHAEDGAELKGHLVGVIVDFRKWTEEDNVSWKAADPSKRGISYEPEYYPVDPETYERVEPVPLSEIM